MTLEHSSTLNGLIESVLDAVLLKKLRCHFTGRYGSANGLIGSVLNARCCLQKLRCQFTTERHGSTNSLIGSVLSTVAATRAVFRLFKSHISFRPDSYLNPAPAKDEFPIVVFVCAAKYIDIQL